MTRALLVVLLAAAAAAPGRAQDVPAHPDRLKYPPASFQVPDASKCRAALKNGMVVYAIEDRTLPKIDLSILVRAGSFWEPKGKEGVAGFTGTLMRTGGTAKRKPEEVDEELDFLAAQLGVRIEDTSATVSMSALSKDLDATLDLLVDVLARPAFAQEKLDLEKARAMQRLKGRNDATAAIEARESQLLFYGEYPSNRHPTSDSVGSITREDLAAFHKRFFHPGNMIMAVAGDFSREGLIAEIEKAFGDWPIPPAEAVTVPPVEHQPEPGVYFFQAKQQNIPQGRVTFGHLGIELTHPDSFAVRVMSYILGQGGFSSRLMQRVRTDEGLAYDVRSDYRPGIAYRGTFRILFQSKSESCLYAAKICLEEIGKMQTTEVSEAELSAAKNFYLDAFPGFFFSTPIQTASTFAGAEYNRYPKDYYPTYRDRIAAVTAADVKRVAKEHMRRDRLVFVFVGNVAAMKGGDGQHEVAPSDFGTVVDVPLPDPLTLKRPHP